MSEYKFCCKRTGSFSLIELMVVIAVVGIIAAIATPVYKTQVAKSKISRVFPSVNRLLQEIKIYHDIHNHGWPDTISYNGFTITRNTGTAVVVDEPSSNIYAIRYNSASFHDAVTLMVTLKGLGSYGIPGYVEPASISDVETQNAIQFAMEHDPDTKEFYTTVCGQHDPSTTVTIDTSYMPKICNCLYTRDWFLNKDDCITGN